MELILRNPSQKYSEIAFPKNLYTMAEIVNGRPYRKEVTAKLSPFFLQQNPSQGVITGRNEVILVISQMEGNL